MTTAPSATPKPRRRWLQFSLRTMLVLMLVLGSGFGWIGMKVKQARQQREAVKAFEKLGGSVSCEPSPGGMIRTAVAWVGRLLGEDLSVDVRTVYLSSNFQVTDAGLAHLRGLTQLQGLYLDQTPVTDTGLEHLRGLTQLQVLHLDSTPVTDAGLQHLRGLTQLQVLSLNSTEVTGAGLEHLRGLTQLQGIYLANTPVTGARLAHLRGLTQLQGLHLELLAFVSGFKLQICCGHGIIPAFAKTLHDTVGIEGDAELAVPIMHLQRVMHTLAAEQGGRRRSPHSVNVMQLLCVLSAYVALGDSALRFRCSRYAERHILAAF